MDPGDAGGEICEGEVKRGDRNDSDYGVFNEVHERVWVRRKDIPSCASEILRPLHGTIGNLLDCVVELTEESRFCRLAALAVPFAIVLDLHRGVFEELEMHYRSERCK
jgi:hypothetical protein